MWRQFCYKGGEFGFNHEAGSHVVFGEHLEGGDVSGEPGPPAEFEHPAKGGEFAVDAGRCGAIAQPIGCVAVNDVFGDVYHPPAVESGRQMDQRGLEPAS